MSMWSAFNTGILISQSFRQGRIERDLLSIKSTADHSAARAAQLQGIRETLYTYKNLLSAVLERQATSIDDALLLGYFRTWVATNNVTVSSFSELTDMEYLSSVTSLAARVEDRCCAAFSSDDLLVVAQLVRAHGAKFSLQQLAVWSKVRSMMWGGRLIWGGKTGPGLFIFLFVTTFMGWLFMSQLLTSSIGPFQKVETPFAFFPLLALFAASVVLARSMTACAMHEKLGPLDGRVDSRITVAEIDNIVHGLRNSSIHEFTLSNDPLVALSDIANREQVEVQRLGVSDWRA